MLKVLLFSAINIFLPLVLSNDNVTINEGNANVTLANPSSKDVDSVLRIVNGKRAEKGQFKYMISIKEFLIKLNERIYASKCGGTLIADNTVLSAAHCFEEPGNACQRLCKKAQLKSLDRYYVVADNLHNVAQEEVGGQWRRLIKVAIPRRYWVPKNDIAIAFTNPPFTINANVKPIPYATTYMDYGSIVCKIAGYGGIDYRTLEPAAFLLWADVELIPARRCSHIHKKNQRDFICISNAKVDVLPGDSGGPLVCQDTKDPHDKGEGVVAGVACGRRGNNSFYTRVSNFRGFIAKGGSYETSLPVAHNVYLSTFVSFVMCTVSKNICYL